MKTGYFSYNTVNVTSKYIFSYIYFVQRWLLKVLNILLTRASAYYCI